MVKLTVVGRVNDGLPISQGPLYEEDGDNTIYKQHAEFLLHEISMAALPPSATTILLPHHHCFNYVVKNGVCFITLCDALYPRKLAFHYLQDLQKEFDKIDLSLVKQITKPYSFIKFSNQSSKFLFSSKELCSILFLINLFYVADNIICNIRRQYIDTRTQANLSKLKANHKQELHVHTEQMSLVVEWRRRSDMLERMMKAHKSAFPVWGSESLEVIAVKWTPITIIFIVSFVLLWSSFKQ
ncbi:25.3 kDa vesicle transport protein isoform X1 [Lactuca sativa]|uniref:25.3 kDa vesicle transport protein isoform X1 n=1 Tax=Lactuca sativa TaxID=4236 RepID=UPI000CD85015|nr:25.3 kDa vesicle transport protein isoform X1 [Lactuca sativa]